MVNYIKEKRFKFKLNDLNVVEEFTIWKKWGLKEDVPDPDGNPMQFPIKDGGLTGKDNKIRDVQTEVKFLKQKEFLDLYPELSRNTKNVRTILVEQSPGEFVEGVARFSKTSNDKIGELVTMGQSMNANPLDMIFEQFFDQQQAPAKMYKIEVVKGGGNIPAEGAHVVSPTGEKDVDETTIQQQSQVAAQVVQTPPVEPVPPIPTTDPLGLSEKEKQVLGAVKAIDATVTEERFMQIMKANEVKEDRAKIIYEKRYK